MRGRALMPTGWWRRVKAQGLCPRCLNNHTGPEFYCRDCRLAEAARAATYYTPKRPDMRRSASRRSGPGATGVDPGPG